MLKSKAYTITKTRNYANFEEDSVKIGQFSIAYMGDIKQVSFSRAVIWYDILLVEKNYEKKKYNITAFTKDSKFIGAMFVRFQSEDINKKFEDWLKEHKELNIIFKDVKNGTI